jgi:hypothetical protein
MTTRKEDEMSDWNKTIQSDDFKALSSLPTGVEATGGAVGWIEWHGGENPVPGINVDVKFADGEIETNIVSEFWKGGGCDWWRHQSNKPSEHITAYRLPTPTSNTREGRMSSLAHSGVKNASIPGESEGVREGQWAVTRGCWRDEVGEVTKVSDKQVRTRRHGHRESHHQPSDILFAGTEKDARDLLSVLTGLGVRHQKNRRQIDEQHQASRAAAIAKATTADEPSPSPSTDGDDK